MLFIEKIGSAKGVVRGKFCLVPQVNFSHVTCLLIQILDLQSAVDQSEEKVGIDRVLQQVLRASIVSLKLSFHPQ